MHTSQFKIYETFLDLYGHVNNAKYLELYEQARWDWLDEAGLSRGLIERSGLGPVILQAEITYRRELKARTTISIRTWVASYEGKIFKIQQEMRLEDDHVASTAVFTGGLMDLKARKLVEPTAAWREAFSLDAEDRC